MKPAAFLGGPAPYHPPATPLCRTEDAPAAYVPRQPARLTVRADGWVYLNGEAAKLLPAGVYAADLRPPLKPGEPWHLDLRPGGLCQLLPVGQTDGVRFRALGRTRQMLGACAGPLSFCLGTNQHDLFALSANS